MSFSAGSFVSHFDLFSLDHKIYESVCVCYLFFSSGFLLILDIFFQFLYTRKGCDSSVGMWILDSGTDTEKGLRWRDELVRT